MKSSKTLNPKIVVIGGGTGSFAALTGLKKYPVELSAIVSMMDSGGSSGHLRDELGVLPPGDIRQCLVALSTSSKILRDIFNYRYETGDLKGHNFGNIFLSTLEKTTGSLEKAITEIGKILRINGKVIPVTFSKTDLCVELIDGKKIYGETHIDEVENQIKRARIKKAFLKPRAKVNPQCIKAILEADLILIGPGDLYTSIIPNLLVKGISEALKKSKAQKIFVLNIMTKYGQTTNYGATDHIKDLEKYLGENNLDMVIINTETPSPKTLDWYKKHNEAPVIDDLKKSKYKKSRQKLIKNVLLNNHSPDKLKRSIIRHDPDKLAQVVMKLLS